MKRKKFKEIQKIIDEYIQTTREFLHILETIEDKKIRKILIKHALLYGALNINLAMYMVGIIPHIMKSKSVEEEFERLMRQLEKGD